MNGVPKTRACAASTGRASLVVLRSVILRSSVSGAERVAGPEGNPPELSLLYTAHVLPRYRPRERKRTSRHHTPCVPVTALARSCHATGIHMVLAIRNMDCD